MVRAASFSWRYWRRLQNLASVSEIHSQSDVTVAKQSTWYGVTRNSIPSSALMGLSSHHLRKKTTFSTLIPPPTQHETITTSTKQTPNEQAVTHKQKIQQLVQKYGSTFVATYLGIYVTTLVSLFSLLESGAIDVDFLSHVGEVVKGYWSISSSVDPSPLSDGATETTSAQEAKPKLVENMTAYLSKYEWLNLGIKEKLKDPHVKNLAVAWFIVKFTEPVRLAATICLIPRVAVLFGKKI